ncbi:MAG: hypothetical protein V3T22_04165, partial [Planctomycetota bacterium]
MLPTLNSLAHLVLCALVLTGALVAAQEAGDGTTAAFTGPAAARAAGTRALDAGRKLEARRHFEHALASRPGDRELLELVLATLDAEEDAQARVLWTHRWVDALADAAGRAPSPGGARRLLAQDPWAERLAVLRAAAVSELSSLARARRADGARRPQELLVADWAARLARDLASRSPALEASLAEHRAAGFPALRRPHPAVVSALEQLGKRALGRGDSGLAVRVGRVLHGLGVQAGFEDLRGEVPSGVARMRASGADLLARARTRQRRDLGEPWTVDDLQWLTSEEGEAFTRQHDGFDSPGAAVSPQGWYRVETDCGFETLLGVASTVELHHRRLARWYGADPFALRPGMVRIVPESSGLESEGAPFWWAAGFQGGDTTVMRFAQGNIEGLGHGITHELTHRFDGALFPGQPAWLTEGKAVWTGGAYGPAKDEGFVAHHASFGTLTGVHFAGWGRAAKLATLIGGDLEDYRDNYSAGYALYVYLNTWEVDGARLFQERLQAFMRGGAQRRSAPREFFLEHFCDGAGGRPADLQVFAEGFDVFLGGFAAEEPADWTARYTQRVPSTPEQSYVYDEPTWTWERHRSEPFFGQDQARRAGELLLEAGESRAGVRALVWALDVDGREPRLFARLAAALGDPAHKDAAWVAAHSQIFPRRASAVPIPLLQHLPRTRALVAGLREAAQEHGRAGAQHVAAALGADHDRLGSWLGLAPLALALPDPSPDPSPEALDIDLARRALGGDGWVEDELVGHDEDRIPGLWHATGDGDLLVGRRSPRTGTGSMDRAGGGLAFVRSVRALLPGTYRIRTRVHLTTAQVNAAVVLGYDRRDRSIRFSFSGTNADFAADRTTEGGVERLNWRLSGMWQRDGALAGSTPSGGIDFGRPRTSFVLELLVDGASLQAFIDGRRLGTYHTADGRPIEGHVGFATSVGAIRVTQPSVRRLERSRLAGVLGLEPQGLDLAGGRSPMFEVLQNKPVHGVAPRANGTLLLWIPMPWPEPGTSVDLGAVERRARESASRLAAAVSRAHTTQPVVIVL